MSKFVAMLLLGFLPVGTAADTIATPLTISSVIEHAEAGNTIRLAPGRYGRIAVRDRHWSPPIVIEATAATLSTVRADEISGLTWHGGVFEGGDSIPDGIKFEQGDHIIVDGAAFHHYTSVGIAVGRVTDARLTNNVFTESGSDGIDVALSQRVIVDHNKCTDFHPLPGAHPDCVQMWSKPNFPPTTDVIVSNNVAIGDMQGFTAFDGPYDRITIVSNFAKVSFWHGIALYDCHNCTIRDNHVQSVHNSNYPVARAWILAKGGVDVINCNNYAKDYPADLGRKRCKRTN